MAKLLSDKLSIIAFPTFTLTNELNKLLLREPLMTSVKECSQNVKLFPIKESIFYVQV